MIKITKKTTASFDVDSQNGFTERCMSELPVMDGQSIVPALNEQAKYADFRIMSKDAHPQDGIWVASESEPQFSKVSRPNVDIRWNSHCVVGTFGSDLIEGLPHPSTYDFLIYKGVERDMHPYSAAYHDLGKTISTGIIEWAKQKHIDTFIVGGLATDYCVKETAIDLAFAGFNVIVNLDASRSIDADLTETLQIFEAEGVKVIQNIKEIILN